MSLRVDLGGIQFNTGARDASGNVWLLTEMDGWSSAPVRQNLLDFAVKNGAAIGRGSYASRALTVAGICKTAQGDYWGAWNNLLAQFADPNVPVVMAVTEDVTKTLTVYKTGTIKNSIKPGHFEFQINLVAPDPNKYGAQQFVTINNGASVYIINSGNAVSEAVQVTVSATGAVALRNNTYQKTLTTGGRDSAAGTIFDMRARTVYSGDDNRYTDLHVTNQWWALAPGRNSIVNNGETPVAVRYRPAWV